MNCTSFNFDRKERARLPQGYRVLSVTSGRDWASPVPDEIFHGGREPKISSHRPRAVASPLPRAVFTPAIRRSIHRNNFDLNQPTAWAFERFDGVANSDQPATNILAERVAGFLLPVLPR